MRHAFCLGIAFLLFLLTPSLRIDQCSAEIIKYQNGNGKIHFTSDRASIPEGAKVLKVFDTGQGGSDKSEEGGLERQQAQKGVVPREQVSAQDGIIMRVLQDMVREYYATHTYSKTDFFVCADMAPDVWNMVETKGINARIAVGNIQNSHADWRMFNHAWVMAELSPDKWLALETTLGTIVHGEDNRNYYRGLFFNTPREFKEYVDLKKRVRALSLRTKDLEEDLKAVKKEYDQELRRHNDLTDEYNEKYSDKRLSKSRFKKSMEFREWLNEQAMVVKELEGRGQQLLGIINANLEEMRGISQQLNQPIERLEAN